MVSPLASQARSSRSTGSQVQQLPLLNGTGLQYKRLGERNDELSLLERSSKRVEPFGTSDTLLSLVELGFGVAEASPKY